MLISAIRSGNMMLIIASIFASIFLVFCVIPLHEYAHAWVAYKMGDNTAKLRGQLTLNPLAHIDPIGAIMIVLIGFGWGKPCPIDERNFKNPRKGIAFTALAGPVSNLLLGFILIFFSVAFVALFPAFSSTVLGVAIYNFFYISAEISIFLAVLNLLPLPPLDGFRVLSVFLSDKAYYTVMANQSIISIIVIVLLFSNILTVPLSALANFFIHLFTTLSTLPFSALLGCIM